MLQAKIDSSQSGDTMFALHSTLPFMTTCPPLSCKCTSAVSWLWEALHCILYTTFESASGQSHTTQLDWCKTSKSVLQTLCAARINTCQSEFAWRSDCSIIEFSHNYRKTKAAPNNSRSLFCGSIGWPDPANEAVIVSNNRKMMQKSRVHHVWMCLSGWLLCELPSGAERHWRVLVNKNTFGAPYLCIPQNRQHAISMRRIRLRQPGRRTFAHISSAILTDELSRFPFSNENICCCRFCCRKRLFLTETHNRRISRIVPSSEKKANHFKSL